MANLSRRTVCGALSAVASLPLQTTLAMGMGEDRFHVDVAERVRALAGATRPSIRLLMPNGSGGNLAPVIAAFQTMTGVTITAIEVPVDELNTELTLDALSGSRSYDVALPATFGLPDLATSNAIQPISEFAAIHEPVGFRDGILYDMGDSFDGELYGFQTDGDAYMMFYNKRMLEGVSEQARYEDRYATALSLPDTWQELDRQMSFFHRPEQDQYGGLLFRTQSYVSWEWWVRFHAKGIWPFSAEMEPQVASDEGVAALEDMIRATEFLAPETSSMGLFENWQRYSRDDVYCNIGWGGSQKYLNGPTSLMRNNMRYSSTPGGLVDGELLVTPYFNWGWNYVVTGNSSHPEISYLFALFASSPHMSTLAVQQSDGFFDPFRPEHYRDEGIQSTYTPEFLTIHRESMRSAIPDLYLRNRDEYFRVLSDWLIRALSRDVSPATALEHVTERWQIITDSVGRAQQCGRWQDLQAKYPPNVRNVLNRNV